MRFLQRITVLITALALATASAPAVSSAAAVAPQLRVSVSPSTITQGQTARVCVRTVPGERVSLHAATLPSRTSRVVRSGASPTGLPCWDVRPGADTRVFAAVADRRRDSRAAVIRVVAPRPTLHLTTGAVAGVRIGTPAAAAEAALRRRLGRPTAVRDEGCELGGVRGRALDWGTAVSVALSDRDTATLTLSGWTVRTGTARHRVVLPFDVRPGTPLATALRRIPGARVSESPFGFLLTSERVPGMIWFLAGEAAPGAVDQVALNPVLCD